MNKILFFAAILIVGFSVSCNNQGGNNSQSQDGPGGFGDRGNFDPEEMAQRQVDRLSEQLDLSEDQQKQIYDMTIENFENRQEMRGQMGGDTNREAMREQMQKAREEQDQKMKTILTDEQWEKYEVYQEEMRARRGQGRPGAGQR